MGPQRHRGKVGWFVGDVWRYYGSARPGDHRVESDGGGMMIRAHHEEPTTTSFPLLRRLLYVLTRTYVLRRSLTMKAREIEVVRTRSGAGSSSSERDVVKRDEEKSRRRLAVLRAWVGGGMRRRPARTEDTRSVVAPPPRAAWWWRTQKHHTTVVGGRRRREFCNEESVPSPSALRDERGGDGVVRRWTESAPPRAVVPRRSFSNCCWEELL